MVRCIFSSHSDGKARCWDKNSIWSWHCGLQTRRAPPAPRASVCGIWWDQTGNVVGVMTSGLAQPHARPCFQNAWSFLTEFSSNGLRLQILQAFTCWSRETDILTACWITFPSRNNAINWERIPVQLFFQPHISYSIYTCSIFAVRENMS